MPIQHIPLRRIQEKQPFPISANPLKPSLALFEISMDHKTRELEGGNPARAVVELIQPLSRGNQVDVTSRDCRSTRVWRDFMEQNPGKSEELVNSSRIVTGLLIGGSLQDQAALPLEASFFLHRAL